MSKTHRSTGNKIQQDIDRPAQKAVSRNSKKLSQRPASKFGLAAIWLIIVCAVVFAAHWPALNAKALSFDDNYYLLENQLVQNPSWFSVGRFFREILEPSTVEGYYQPLTMISLMVDYALGGRPDNLAVFHLTSLVLHVINTTLVIVLLYFLFGRFPTAVMIGLLFGVHPLTVESIPWVAERKTLLATFFALLSLIFYVRYAKNNNPKLYITSVLIYVLSLMAKPSSIALPFLLLLLDYWPLHRVNKKAILEKIPLFAICTVFAAVIFISQSRTFGVKMPGERSFWHIVLTICHNIVLYLSNMAWPANLSLFYPFPKPMNLSDPQVLAGLVGTILLIPALVISLRWTQSLLTGWLFFFVSVFPTMGVVRFHDMIAADRHVYLPFVGILLPLAHFLGRFWDSAKNISAQKARQVGTVAVIVIIAAMEISATRQYLVYWKDTETHRRRMLALAPRESILHNLLGLELFYQKKYDQALIHYTEALQIKPNDAEVYNNLAGALLAQGKLDKAISCYRQALQLEPNLIKAYYNMGIALSAQGKTYEAIGHFGKFLQAQPNDAEAHNNIADLLQSQGKIDEAIVHYRQALQINPNHTESRRALEILLRNKN